MSKTKSSSEIDDNSPVSVVVEVKEPVDTRRNLRCENGHNQHGIDLVFRDVTMNIGERRILHDISGRVRRGEMLAIMGPSGAGKSTLLKTFMGYVPLHSGDISINKQPINKQLRRKLCYVLQEDVFFTNLTLRQTLTFAARLRLPDEMKYSDKMLLVEKIVDELDLRKCLDTVVGDFTNPGLSGGEKKRASIACELIASPMLMLLDEPTSGLDSSITFNLMTTLKMYTQTFNKTVVTTIHQPSSAIFHMFDWVLLLTEGHVAYFGPTKQILSFFADLGLHCTPQYNPADFILEKVKESKETASMIISAAYESRRSTDWPAELRSEKWPVEDHSVPADVAGINGCSVQQSNNTSYTASVDPRSKDLFEDEFGKMADTKRKWLTGFRTQYRTLLLRNLMQSLPRILSKMTLARYCSVMFICGMLWFQLPRDENTVNDRLGLIFFCVLNWVLFTMLDTIGSVTGERPLIKKERPSGLYRASAYYCAKVTAELPLILIQPVIFYTILYWTCNLNQNPGVYSASVGSLVITIATSQSISLFLGMVTPNVRLGIMVGSVAMLGSILAGGFYRQSPSDSFVWLKYTSFVHYSFDALAFLEFHHGDLFECLPATISTFSECTVASNETLYIPGAAILKVRGISENILLNLSVLGGMTMFFHLSSYLAFRFYDPLKGPRVLQRNVKQCMYKQKSSGHQISPVDHNSKPNIVSTC